MAASCNSFTDLPSEIRNQIYDEYLANVEDTAVATAEESDLSKIQDVKFWVLDCDYSHAMNFFNAVGECSGRSWLFEKLTIALAFTKAWSIANSKIKLEKWVDYICSTGPGFCTNSDNFEYVAVFDRSHVQVEDAYLPEGLWSHRLGRNSNYLCREK